MCMMFEQTLSARSEFFLGYCAGGEESTGVVSSHFRASFAWLLGWAAGNLRTQDISNNMVLRLLEVRST